MENKYKYKYEYDQIFEEFKAVLKVTCYKLMPTYDDNYDCLSSDDIEFCKKFAKEHDLIFNINEKDTFPFQNKKTGEKYDVYIRICYTGDNQKIIISKCCKNEIDDSTCDECQKNYTG